MEEIVIIEEDKVEAKQEKVSLNEGVKRSQPLTKHIIQVFCTVCAPKIFASDRFDSAPYVSSARRDNFRPPDIAIEDRRCGEIINKYIECKGFGMLVKYDATGLAQNYVRDILLPYGAENVYLAFEESEKSIGERLRTNHNIFSSFAAPLTKNNIPWSYKTVVAKDKHDKEYGKYRIVPYGERLDILMKKENRLTEGDESVIKCSFEHGKYHGQPQYLWKVECMDIFANILKRDLGKRSKL